MDHITVPKKKECTVKTLNFEKRSLALHCRRGLKECTVKILNFEKRIVSITLSSRSDACLLLCMFLLFIASYFFIFYLFHFIFFYQKVSASDYF